MRSESSPEAPDAANVAKKSVGFPAGVGKKLWAGLGKAQDSEGMQQMIEESKKQRTLEAKVAFERSMRKAREAWKASIEDDDRLKEASAHLKVAASHMPNCEVVNRFHAKVRAREGLLDEALNYAGIAVSNRPTNPRNHHALAIASQRKGLLESAGVAYMTSMSRGLPGNADTIGFKGFLSTVGRDRLFYGDLRPSHRKIGALELARTPSRGNIFDPKKAIDDDAVAGEDMELPDPPQLFHVGSEQNSVQVKWGQSASGMTIYAYELQMSPHEVVWEGSDFFDGYRNFETVHRGAPHVTEKTIHGLRVDSKVLLRIRAQGYSGCGEWEELVVSTLPPPSRMKDALPLPRKWLQVDIGDLVPMHMMEVGGDPKRFFREVATCFTPIVRDIRRLFTGWSRTGLVGQKTRQNELSRMQFMRFAKEVGLCNGGGAMCQRSGARLLSTNDVDRLFARANMDTREMQRSGSRGGDKTAAALNLDGTKIANAAEDALDDLLEAGSVEADPGEAELREKLRPLFDKYDEDGSGSVSTDEIGMMAASLKIEMSAEQVQQLMDEADPDGSGEIEFDELVAVLKKQMKDGGGGSDAMAALFGVSATNEESDGGSSSMVLYEFIHALIRMAWECYPTPGTGIGKRLGQLLDRAVLPGSSHLLISSDPMEAELASKRVQAITDYYNDQLLDVFAVFAATDVSLAAQAHMETMSFAELIFMMKTGELIDANLTVAGLTAIFAQVNNQAADDGEKDDDAEELTFTEFKSCMCRIANAKIPAKDRGGVPFEYTWHSFLQLMFLPKMKKVMRDMKRGVAKKTL